MLTRDDIEEIARALPETTIERSPDGRPAFRVHGKVYGCQRDRRPDAIDPDTGERLDDVMMFRVADEGVKQALLADPSGAWFTTPHFNGWPAILVRLRDAREVTFVIGVCAAAIFVVGAMWAVVHPERGLQDRVAGTYLVPR